MVACYPGPHAPHDFTSFLQPLEMELIELFNGIPIQNSLDESHKILKAYLAFVTADLDARTKLQKMVGFNGYFGCFYCKLKGEYIKEKKHVYFPSKDNNISELLRDSSEIEINAENQAFGVRGIPPFWNLQKIVGSEFFDIYTSYSIDTMHSVFLGVVSRITNLWFTNSQTKEYGQKENIGKIEECIQNLQSQAPSEMGSRTIRSISQRNNWTAHEWKCWLFYWSPIIMYNFLPQSYYNNWTQLIESIKILCQYKITENDYQTASHKITLFVYKYEQQYGYDKTVMNVHLLTHLPDCVKKFGPIWVYWNFPFERALGYFSQFVFSTKNPVISYCSSSQLCQVYSQLAIDTEQQIPHKETHMIRNTKVKLSSLQELKENPNGIFTQQGATFFKTKSLVILNDPKIVLHTTASSLRNSTGITFKESESKQMGQIAAIYLAFINNSLEDIKLQVKTYAPVQGNHTHYNNLFNLFYKEDTTQVIIPINTVIGRCFYINSQYIPKSNQKETIIGIELHGIFDG